MFCLHRLLKVFVLLKHNTHSAPRSMFKQGIYPALALLFAATLLLGGMGSELALASPSHVSGSSMPHASQRTLLQVHQSITAGFGSVPAVALNGVGALELFDVTSNGDMQHMWQTGCTPGSGCTGWSAWHSLGFPSAGGTFKSDPAVALNGVSGLEVFAVGSNGEMEHIYQTQKACCWSAWHSLGFASTGGTFNSDPAVALNGGKALEVFAIDSGFGLQHIWQTCAGCSWSNWHLLGNRLVSNPAVALNGASNPALEVFAPQFSLGNNGEMQHIWQTGCNPGCTGWSAWQSLGGSFALGGAVALNGVSGLELFAIGGSGEMEHIYQTQKACCWSAWHSLGFPSTGGDFALIPAVALNTGKALELFSVDTSGDMQHIWQTCAGCSWSNWHSLGFPA